MRAYCERHLIEPMSACNNSQHDRPYKYQLTNLQLKSLLQTNVARPIFWSICLLPPPPCTRVKTRPTTNKQTFRIPHITHRSAVSFRTFHSAFYLPHSAIPHFTNSRSVVSVVRAWSGAMMRTTRRLACHTAVLGRAIA